MPAPEPRQMPRWIVTGSSGFIGTHLSARLGDVCPADSFYGVDKEKSESPVRYRHVQADIRCLDSLRNITSQSGRPDVAFHLAASAEVLTPWSQVPALLSSNLEGTYNVLEGLDPRLIIFASSSSVYGNAGLRPADPRLSILQPICLYAISKVSGEMMVRDWARESMDFRPQVYAYGDGRLGYDYSYKNFPLVRTRLLEAGIRLAGLLNEIYK